MDTAGDFAYKGGIKYLLPMFDNDISYNGARLDI